MSVVQDFWAPYLGFSTWYAVMDMIHGELDRLMAEELWREYGMRDPGRDQRGMSDTRWERYTGIGPGGVQRTREERDDG